MLTTDKNRMEDKITTFSKFGDLGNGGITRLSLSAEAIEARNEFKKRGEDLGMTVKMDDIGNMYAIYPGQEDLPAIIAGSHADSVITGGNYDGIYGVLSGLEACETIIKEGIKTRHPVGVMIWTNEEGARFEPAMMSSGIVTGKFDKDTMFAVKDKKGVTFGEALKASGFEGSKENRLNPEDYCAYFEPHIEQGPVLISEGYDIGVVQGVVGMVNYDIIVEGVSDHAGTTPQKYRKDAFRAASKLVLDLWDELGKLDDELVYTMGEITCVPNVHTIIPRNFKFSLDSRHQNPEIIKKVVEVIKNLPTEVYGCKVSSEEHWGRDTIHFNEQMVGFIEEGCKELEYSYKKMYSGAGHDAQFVSYMLPSTMLFIPSVDGHSHCVEEYTPIEDCWRGANVLLHAMLDADKNL